MSGELGLFNQNNFIKALQKYKKKTICTTLRIMGISFLKQKRRHKAPLLFYVNLLKYLYFFNKTLSNFYCLFVLRYEVVVTGR